MVIPIKLESVKTDQTKGNIILFPGCKNPYPLEDTEIKKLDSYLTTKEKSADPITNIDDIKKLTNYFIDGGKWIHYLVFVVSVNMGRRISDTLKLKWSDMFDQNNDFHDCIRITEKKTGKPINITINVAVKSALSLYIQQKKIDPSEMNLHKDMLFYQFDGTYKGHVLTYSAYNKQLKIAAHAVGVKGHITTHSTRKTFGRLCLLLHPNDPSVMITLMSLYNHSDLKTTNIYLGKTQERVNQYLIDIGVMWDNCIDKDEGVLINPSSPVITINADKLRSILLDTYKKGQNNPDATAEEGIIVLNTVLDTVEREMVKIM